MMIQTKKLVVLTTIILACLTAATQAAETKPQAKPNFVFFLVDDFGWGSISAMGDEFIETPNIDKLAKSGMQFNNAYAACTVCSPSRAAILTGAYPGRTKLTDWIPGHRRGVKKLTVPDWQMYMDHERILLPEALKENEYSTYFLGKWHLMPIESPKKFKNHYPESHGFDKNIGGREWGSPNGKGRYFHPLDMPNVTSKQGDYLTDRLTDYAVDLVDTNKNNPFLMYFSYYTVHQPIQGKPELVKKYTDKKNANRGKFKNYDPSYAAMIQSLDESVGRVVAKLEKAGLRDNTYIIFTGDNGSDLNLYCGGLKGHKAKAHEGGTREVLLISGPGIKKSTQSDIPVIGTDFYPTILDLADIPLKPEQHQDGVSLKPILKEGKPIEKRSLFWHYPHYHQTLPYGAVRNGDWKLIEFFEDGRLELYNLKDDMAETKNLAKKMPEKAEELLKELKAWRVSVKAQMPMPVGQLYPYFKAAKASSKEKGNVAENAADTNKSSRWAAGNGTYPQWLEVELKKTQQVKGVTFAFRNKTIIQYKVDVLGKDGKWQTVVDKSENKEKVQTVKHTFDAEISKLKVTIIKAQQGWATITDLQLIDF